MNFCRSLYPLVLSAMFISVNAHAAAMEDDVTRLDREEFWEKITAFQGSDNTMNAMLNAPSLGEGDQKVEAAAMEVEAPQHYSFGGFTVSFSTMEAIKIVNADFYCQQIEARRKLEALERKRLKRKTNQCSECSRYFKFKSNLSDHIQKEHMGVNPYTCTLCESEFTRKDSFEYHMRSKKHAKRVQELS